MYYKITNILEDADKYAYYNDKFEKQQNDDTYDFDLCFTNSDNIHKYINEGVFLREVHCPVNDPHFRINEKNGQWKANMVLFGKTYDLTKKQDYLYVMNNISSKFLNADYAAAVGNIDMLNYLSETTSFDYSHCAIDWASCNGYVNVLDWFRASDYEFLYSEKAIDFACKNGHECILEWFHTSCYDFLCTENAIDYASKMGHEFVLEWFKSNEYNIMYSENAVNWACRYGHIDIIKWFHNSGLEMLYTTSAIDYAARYGHLEIILWFDTHGYNIEYKNAIDFASRYGHIHVLNWFKYESNLEFMYTEYAIDWACRYGHIHVLNWYIDNNLEFKYTSNAIDYSCRYGHISILNWFKQSKFEFLYTHNSLDYAGKYNHLKIFKWFVENNVSLKYSENVFVWAHEYNHIEIINWLKAYEQSRNIVDGIIDNIAQDTQNDFQINNIVFYNSNCSIRIDFTEHNKHNNVNSHHIFNNENIFNNFETKCVTNHPPINITVITNTFYENSIKFMKLINKFPKLFSNTTKINVCVTMFCVVGFDPQYNAYNVNERIPMAFNCFKSDATQLGFQLVDYDGSTKLTTDETEYKLSDFIDI